MKNPRPGAFSPYSSVQTLSIAPLIVHSGHARSTPASERGGLRMFGGRAHGGLHKSPKEGGQSPLNHHPILPRFYLTRHTSTRAHPISAMPYPFLSLGIAAWSTRRSLSRRCGKPAVFQSQAPDADSSLHSALRRDRLYPITCVFHHWNK